jgi:hypothetical protein
MMRTLILILITALLTGCAHKFEELPPLNPYTAALADTWTTHQAVVVSGGTEVNPLGVNGALAGKLIFLTLLRPQITDPEKLYTVDRTATSVWMGAASSNLIQLAIGAPIWFALGAGVILGVTIYELYPR